MKTKRNLRTLGITALAAVSLSQSGNATSLTEENVRAIDRLDQIRAEYLKALGMPELAKPDNAQIAQWQNFPNFGNFPNWLNGWRNY